MFYFYIEINNVTVMKIKYNRTSTLNQDGNRFTDDTDVYDKVIFDKGVSGKIPFAERQGGKLIVNLVQQGKVKEIVCEELSRFGRNTIDILNTLKFFDDHSINVVIKNMGIQSMIDNKRNQIWSLVTSILSSMYELEREAIYERTEMGRRVYVMNGGKLGRKVGSVETRKDFLKKDKNVKIISLLEKGKSVRDIAARLNCSATTVCKVKAML
jgi:DNA invertase Pin-like site-specific DNA recombinase